MKYFLIVVVLLIAYSVFAYGRILYYKNYSKNPSITQTDLILGSGTEIKYIAAGDSTGVGVGASDVSKTYAYKLAEHFAQTNSVQYKNIAVSGARTTDLLADQVPQIIAFNPDVVTISIGANDATHLIDKDKVLSNYQEIIRQLSENTKAKIYITNVANFDGAKLLPLPFVKLIEHRSKSINPEIIKLETDRVKIINIHDFGWSNYPDKQVTYSKDYFHPSDIGYENWTNAFLDKIIN